MRPGVRSRFLTTAPSLYRIPTRHSPGRDAAPLCLGSGRRRRARQLSRPAKLHIVDRLFAAAELRLGGDKQQKVRIVRTDGRPR